MATAKQLVESLLDDDPEPEDKHERAYRRLQKLYARRGELQSEQMWHATWARLLRNLKVDEDNIKSLDIDQGKLHGIYLKQGDYGAKIARKEKGKADRDAFLAASASNNMYDEDEARKKAPRIPDEASAFYVPVSPPVMIPVAVLRHWGRS